MADVKEVKIARYALIKNNQVENLFLWAGPEAEPMNFGPEYSYTELTDDDFVNIGYFYVDGKFVAPPLTEEEEQAEINRKISQNQAIKAGLMDFATQRRSVLQDAVDEDMATDEEAALLGLWKKYRVSLSRIDASTPEEIQWPATPE